jgi:hypothetical protein
MHYELRRLQDGTEIMVPVRGQPVRHPPPMPPYPHPVYPQYPPGYAQYPQQPYQPASYERPRRRRKKYRLPGPAKLVLFIVLSFVVGAIHPVCTLIAWGGILTWITARAFSHVA